MSCSDSSAGSLPGNPEGIPARLVGQTDLEFAVEIDSSLRCLEIKITGLAGDWSILVGPHQALDFCFRVIGAVTRLRRDELRDSTP
jgi:hypothetical protein